MIRALHPVFASVSKIGLLGLLILTGWQCLESPNFPDEPFIEFVGMSKDTLHQGLFQEDSLWVRFRFEDGDGDIGKTDTEIENNVFFIDERQGVLDNTFGIPLIPQEGAANGVEGEVAILLFSTCCYYPESSGLDPCQVDDLYPLDTVQYRIYIKDRAGHKSNEILTHPIILKCN